MPVYDYVALDPRGRRVTGTVDAPSPAQARARLRSQGTYAVSIDESAGQGHPYGQGLWRRRLAPRELTAMTRQLATLLGAGVPLVEALDALLQQNPGRALGGLIACLLALHGNSENAALMLAGLRGVEQLTRAEPPPDGERPRFAGALWSDAAGRQWQEIDLEALVRQESFLRIVR